MWKQLFVTTLAFSAISCTAGVYPLHWVLVGEFTQEERELTHRAPKCWNEIAYAQQDVFDQGESISQIHVVDVLPGPYPDAHAVLETRGIHHRIYILRGLPPETFFMSMQHEMGHALGLATHEVGGHIEPPAIMSGGSSSLVVTKNDLAECRRVGACP